MKKYWFFIILALFLAFPEKTQAATYYVPDNYATIQTAVNNVNPGVVGFV